MVDTSMLDKRRARLGAAIRAAKARYEANLGDPGIGDLLTTVNDDFDRIAHEDRDEAERAYDKIEARLKAEQIRIEDDEEDADR